MSDVDLIAVVIAAPAGYVVEVFGLTVYRLENGSYTVEALDLEPSVSYAFDHAADAAKAFVDLREKLKLGFDFEIGARTDG